MGQLPIQVAHTRNSVMRTSRRIILALMLGATPLATQGFAFDGAPVSPDTAIPVVSAQPGAAAALKKVIPPPTPDTSLTSLQYAAEGGHPVAQWKLGRMYADGDGVAQDDLRAFEYFSRIANAHAEDSPSAPQATIVANAFVALGRYYLNGIPNSKIKSDPERAREMFSYAASYCARSANGCRRWQNRRRDLDGRIWPREGAFLLGPSRKERRKQLLLAAGRPGLGWQGLGWNQCSPHR